MKNTKKIFIYLMTTALFSSTANAEYRAFQYLIKSGNFSNTVISTFNPVTYRAYHGGPLAIEITLLKTWMCPGYTGNFRKICHSPEKKLLEHALLLKSKKAQ